MGTRNQETATPHAGRQVPTSSPKLLRATLGFPERSGWIPNIGRTKLGTDIIDISTDSPRPMLYLNQVGSDVNISRCR